VPSFVTDFDGCQEEQNCIHIWSLWANQKARNAISRRGVVLIRQIRSHNRLWLLVKSNKLFVAFDYRFFYNINDNDNDHVIYGQFKEFKTVCTRITARPKKPWWKRLSHGKLKFANSCWQTSKSWQTCSCTRQTRVKSQHTVICNMADLFSAVALT